MRNNGLQRKAGNTWLKGLRHTTLMESLFVFKISMLKPLVNLDLRGGAFTFNVHVRDNAVSVDTVPTKGI